MLLEKISFKKVSNEKTAKKKKNPSSLMCFLYSSFHNTEGSYT